MPLLSVRKPKRLGKYRMGANDMLVKTRECLEVRALGGLPNLRVCDIEIMKIVDRIVVRECDELIRLLRRISTDVAQTIIEDPCPAALGWMLMSKPVLKDLQRTLHEFVPENLAKKYHNGR